MIKHARHVIAVADLARSAAFVWGMREFGIRTVDGHRIMFGSPVPA